MSTQAPFKCVPGQGTLERGDPFTTWGTSKNCSPKHQTAGCIQRTMGRVAQIAGCKTWQAYIRTTWGMSLNCLNVLPLAIGHRSSRMAVKGFAWKACHLGIDTFDAPLLSEWVQHIGVCGRTPNPSIAGSNPATYARLDRTI